MKIVQDGYQIIETTDNAVALCCPACGNDYMHHGDVVVRVRDREDGPGCRIRVLNDGDVSTTQLREDDEEWWGRRDDVEIRLSCENCPAVSKLIIAQHKGQTYMEVRVESK